MSDEREKDRIYTNRLLNLRDDYGSSTRVEHAVPPAMSRALEPEMYNVLAGEIRKLGEKLDARYVERREFERQNMEEWIKARMAEAARMRKVEENYETNLKWAHDTEDKAYERLTAIEASQQLILQKLEDFGADLKHLFKLASQWQLELATAQIQGRWLPQRTFSGSAENNPNQPRCPAIHGKWGQCEFGEGHLGKHLSGAKDGYLMWAARKRQLDFSNLTPSAFSNEQLEDGKKQIARARKRQPKPARKAGKRKSTRKP